MSLPTAAAVPTPHPIPKGLPTPTPSISPPDTLDCRKSWSAATSCSVPWWKARRHCTRLIARSASSSSSSCPGADCGYKQKRAEQGTGRIASRGGGRHFSRPRWFPRPKDGVVAAAGTPKAASTAGRRAQRRCCVANTNHNPPALHTCCMSGACRSSSSCSTRRRRTITQNTAA